MEEDVELCLEVQVDPASKRILSSPEKCRSTLLDVTVVKPKEFEAFGTQRTNTLRADEVRRLITSLEKQRRKKQKLLDKLKYDDTIIKVRKHDNCSDIYRRPKKYNPKPKERIPVSHIDDLERKDFIGISESIEPLFCEIRRSLKNVETRITNMQDINLVISQTTVDESASEVLSKSKKHRNPCSYKPLNNQSVYRVEHAPQDLKSVLVCKNKSKFMGHGEKIEGKCLCENCGTIGLLMECQQHPLLSELSDSPSPASEYNNKRIKNRHKRTRFDMSNPEAAKQTNCGDIAYINLLTKRVKLLEQRLALQEERGVPKEHFRKIMSKVLPNMSPKISKSEISVPFSERHGKKILKVPEKLVRPSTIFDKSFCRSNENIKCYRTNIKYDKGVKERTVRTQKNKATVTEDDVGYVWKWGEEILKPGIDLKNRIVSLLNDILSKFALSENCSTVTTNFAEVGKREEFTSETFKRFMRHVNPKMFNPHTDLKEKVLTHDPHASNYEAKSEKGSTFIQKSAVKDNYRKEHEEHQASDKCDIKEHKQTKEGVQCGKNIDVSYVNPKINQWRKDSHNEFKAEYGPTGQRQNAKGKQEFLKIVGKAKQYQKNVLWDNIWNQAKANGQTKTDKITIKIPVPRKDNKGNDMLETELTIGEVEEILKGH